MNYRIITTARDFISQLDMIEAARHGKRLAELEEIRKAFAPIKADIEKLRDAGINILERSTAAYISKEKLTIEIQVDSADEMRTAVKTLNGCGFIEVDSLSNYAHALEREQAQIIITLPRSERGAVVTEYKNKKVA